MGRNRKEPTTPFQKNLYKLLGPDLENSLRKIEHEIGLSPISIRMWLNGRRNPSIENLIRVADCIGFQWQDVFLEGDQKQKEIIKSIHKVKDKALLDAILSIIASEEVKNQG